MNQLQTTVLNIPLIAVRAPWGNLLNNVMVIYTNDFLFYSIWLPGFINIFMSDVVAMTLWSHCMFAYVGLNSD